jgi:hypothetical protein
VAYRRSDMMSAAAATDDDDGFGAPDWPDA